MTAALALVYRGPAACSECPAALAELLSRSAWGFDVAFVGDAERRTPSAATLASAALYAQPGGGRSLERAYRRFRSSAPLVRDYVRAGGRYLGICMGGYLAAHWRGAGLLPVDADADPFLGSPRADVTTRRDTLVSVRWRGHEAAQHLFFQDGPFFRLPASPPVGTAVLARYASNDEIAAMVTPFGRGWVGVCGPHPEAPAEWYAAHGLPDHAEAGRQLGLDLVDVLMRAETTR